MTGISYIQNNMFPLQPSMPPWLGYVVRIPISVWHPWSMAYHKEIKVKILTAWQHTEWANKWLRNGHASPSNILLSSLLRYIANMIPKGSYWCWVLGCFGIANMIPKLINTNMTRKLKYFCNVNSLTTWLKHAVGESSCLHIAVRDISIVPAVAY